MLDDAGYAPYAFSFTSKHQLPVLDDDNSLAFSHYIVHDSYEPQPSTPSSGPVSASSISSSYSELRSLVTPITIQPPAPQTKRPPGACTRCKKMKMKCEFLPTDSTCQRCKSAREPCTVQGRKPRTPSQREWLLSQIRQKDAMIATLLKTFRPVQSTPITLASTKLSLSPADRALHREALAWAEKAGGVANNSSGAQRWRVKYRERERNCKKVEEDEEDDGDWSSEAESEDPWDREAEEKMTETRPGVVLYPYGLPNARSPMGIIARLSLKDNELAAGTKEKKRGVEAIEKDREAEGETETEDGDGEWGVANPAFFQPGPSSNLALRRVLNERESPPAIIASGLITWMEAEKLFDVFYEYINPYIAVLDPAMHTASTVFERCPFLFTVVCAISLRYYTPPRPQTAPVEPGSSSTNPLQKIAFHFAKTLAATSFVDGYKSPELVQAYFLMSMYGVPARRWEEDRSWFYSGLATRIALDLGLNKMSPLHSKPLSERHARELHNRVRTWLICFNVDRSMATQLGKPSAVWGEEGEGNARHVAANGWYRGKYNNPYDLHLVMYAEFLRVMSRFIEQIYKNGVIDKNCNFRAVTEATEAELRVFHDDITWRYENESDKNDPGCVFRTKLLPLYESYMRLVMYSFGFQDAWKRREQGQAMDPGGDVFFAKCLQSASAMVRHMIDVLAPTGYLKYAPDCFFVMGGFCCAFLLKLLRPEFSSLIDPTQCQRIMSLASSFVDTLASPAVATDESHTPKLYARFLWSQVKLAEKMERSPVLPAVPQGQELVQEQAQEHVQGREQLTLRPCTPYSSSSPSSSSSAHTPSYISQSPDLTREDNWMELSEEDYLATMDAVNSETWLESMLMPGFKWEGDAIGMTGVGVGSIVGSE